MRSSKPVVAAAAAAIVLGGAGLVRGAVKPAAHTDGMTMGSGGSSITVTGAFVRAPIPPTRSAVAYFTVTNPTGTADRILRVTTGAGATAVLHTKGRGGMRATSTRGVVVPSHGRLVLSAGGAHLMIEKLFGRLRAGQTVDIEVDFDLAGAVDVVAPVIAYGAPAPTAQKTRAQSRKSPSGAHS